MSSGDSPRPVLWVRRYLRSSSSVWRYEDGGGQWDEVNVRGLSDIPVSSNDVGQESPSDRVRNCLFYCTYLPSGRATGIPSSSFCLLTKVILSFPLFLGDTTKTKKCLLSSGKYQEYIRLFLTFTRRPKRLTSLRGKFGESVRSSWSLGSCSNSLEE